MKHIAYWITFERDPTPRRFSFPTMLDMLRDLERLMCERGAIEWMNRAY